MTWAVPTSVQTLIVAAGLTEGHTAQVRTNTNYNQQFRINDPIRIELWVNQRRIVIICARQGEGLRGSSLNENGMATPLHSKSRT